MRVTPFCGVKDRFTLIESDIAIQFSSNEVIPPFLPAARPLGP